MTKINVPKIGEIIIRPMQTNDVAEVYRVECRSYTHPWSEKLIYDCVLVGYSCWLVEYKGEIIAYAIYRLAAQEGHLFNIAIHPDYQNRGLGRVFLGFLLDLMRQKQAKEVVLEVRVSNVPARKLYQNFGFVEIGTRKGYYPGVNSEREDGINLQLVF